MESTDLRPGNHIVYGTDVRIEAEPGDISIIALRKLKGQRHNYSPIPITARGLVRLGFTNTTGTGNYFRSNKGRVFDIKMSEDGNGWDFIMGRVDSKFKVNQYELLYIHQLQNLWFALTGVELKSQEYETAKDS